MSSANLDWLRSTADTSTPLLLLRRSMAPMQHGALAITRSMGRLGIPVYSSRLNRSEPAMRSRYLTGAIELPRHGSDHLWIDAVLQLARRHEGAVLLPVDDRAAVAVGDHQQRLAEHFRFPAQPPGLERQLASKRELWKLCCKLALATPNCAFPQSEHELAAVAADYGYPVVLKRSDPWLAPRDPNAPSVAIAHTREDALAAYARMESPSQPHVMVQEYIPGESDSVWMFNGYFNAASEACFASTGRKLRQRGPRTGATTLGITRANATVADAAVRLMSETQYRGIVDMGFRYDQRDELYKLIDVNPRIGSTFRLFGAENGVDVATAMHLDLTSRPVPPCTTHDGRKWVNEPHDARASMQLMQEGTLGLAAWRQSLQGIDETAWLATDDPLPFLTMVGGLGSQVVRRLGSKGLARTAGAGVGRRPQAVADRSP